MLKLIKLLSVIALIGFLSACGGTSSTNPDQIIEDSIDDETSNDDVVGDDLTEKTSVYSEDGKTLTVTTPYETQIHKVSGEFNVVVTSTLHGKLNYSLVSFDTTTIATTETFSPQVTIETDYISAFAYSSLEDADRIHNATSPEGMISFAIMDFFATTPTTGTFDIAGFYIKDFDAFDDAGAQYSNDIAVEITTAETVGENIHLIGSFVADIPDIREDVTKVEVSFDMIANKYIR